MYFIFEIAFSSNKNYIANLIRAYAEEVGIEAEILQTKDKIVMIFNQDDEKLESFLLDMQDVIPASLFLGEGYHHFAEEKPSLVEVSQTNLPVNIAPCPRCQKEMFDVSTRRFYYPFTSCNNCGSQHSFLTKYPYVRENTTMKFLVPCSECEDERAHNSLRKNYPLISCIECGIGLRMLSKESEYMALDKGDYRNLFKASAGAISAGKTVLMKTMNGYRKFFYPNRDLDAIKKIKFTDKKLDIGLAKSPYSFNQISEEKVGLSTLLMENAASFNKHLMFLY